MARLQQVILVPETTDTGSGMDFAAVPMPDGWKIARVVLSVSAASAGGDLDVWVQEAHDGSAWTDVARFTRMSAAAPFVALVELETGEWDTTPSRDIEHQQMAEATVRKVGWPAQLRVTTAQSKTTATYTVIAYIDRQVDETIY